MGMLPVRTVEPDALFVQTLVVGMIFRLAHLDYGFEVVVVVVVLELVEVPGAGTTAAPGAGTITAGGGLWGCTITCAGG